jgi:glycosyltransferase involved in cell wall biosynthesis
VTGNTSWAAEVATELFALESKPQVSVVYNGIEWELLDLSRGLQLSRDDIGVPEGALLVGTDANLRALKRVDLLVRALLCVPDAFLLVIGDGPERTRLEQLAADLGVASRTQFVGRQVNVVDYLVLCDVFSLPSGPEESFGNSAVEAMGLGLPTIVLSDGGGLVEHVVHGETGVIADDPRDLGEWLTRLHDPALRARLGAEGKVAVRRKYTIERMVAGYAQVYAEAGA